MKVTKEDIAATINQYLIEAGRGGHGAGKRLPHPGGKIDYLNVGPLVNC